MLSGLDVPVVLIVFNRPDHVAEVFDAVRAARPSTLLIVADGPRADHPDDLARCRAARAVVDHVDWPCEVLRNVSEDNLGCDLRVTSGLDWAFSHVERAIVLEDDIVPDPSFFPWCAAMLDRYRGSDIMHISGRNDLGRWGPPDADHLVVRWGSVYGWATWASAWRSVDRDLTIAGEPGATTLLEAIGPDPLLQQHFRLHLANHVAAVAENTQAAWDDTWRAAYILAGGWSVIPPVNLIRNCGFGDDATHTTYRDDLGAALTCGEAPSVDPSRPRPEPDPDYDRRCRLVEILATYREPAMVARLARSRQLLVDAAGRPRGPRPSPPCTLRHARRVHRRRPAPPRRRGGRRLPRPTRGGPRHRRRAPGRIVSASPTVGVVVAVRNGVDHLAAALDGVLSQEPAPTDVVVLDGGSTDGSADLAAKVNGVRVVAQVGLGLGAARNQALRGARGAGGLLRQRRPLGPRCAHSADPPPFCPRRL